MGFENWATKYASLIFLGLSLTIGYVVWRVISMRKSRPNESQEEAPRELGRSGLEGPTYRADEQAALTKALQAEIDRERELQQHGKSEGGPTE